MPNTIGYHYVRSGYGLWLPGDERGHWSEAWDEQIGFYEPHHLHKRDPIRHRMAEERMKHPPVRFTPEILRQIEFTIETCQRQSAWKIAAASVEATHLHLLIPYTAQDIHGTAKWLGQQMTKAIHQFTSHEGPVFCKGHWLQFIFERTHWENTIAYVERHNVRRGESARPYSFLNDEREDRG